MAKIKTIQDLYRIIEKIKKTMNVNDIGIYKINTPYQNTNVNLLVEGNTKFDRTRIVGISFESNGGLITSYGGFNLSNTALPENIEVYHNLDEEQVTELKEIFDDFLDDYKSEIKSEPNKIIYTQK